MANRLGRGAYGTVYLCEDKKSGEQVAVKHVKQAARHGKSMLREIRLLARLRHENLLYLLDFAPLASANFEDIYLVLPRPVFAGFGPVLQVSGQVLGLGPAQDHPVAAILEREARAGHLGAGAA